MKGEVRELKITGISWTNFKRKKLSGYIYILNGDEMKWRKVSLNETVLAYAKQNKCVDVYVALHDEVTQNDLIGACARIPGLVDSGEEGVLSYVLFWKSYSGKGATFLLHPANEHLYTKRNHFFTMSGWDVPKRFTSTLYCVKGVK